MSRDGLYFVTLKFSLLFVLIYIGINYEQVNMLKIHMAEHMSGILLY